MQSIRTGTEYEAVRDAAMGELALHKSARRIKLGEQLCLVLENRRSIVGALEETLRAEQITNPGQITQEWKAAQLLLGGPKEITAVLSITASDQAELTKLSANLAGVEQYVQLLIDGGPVPVTVQSLPTSDNPSAAHYLRFTLGHAMQNALGAGSTATLIVDHPQYRAKTELNKEQVAALLAGLVDSDVQP